MEGAENMQNMAESQDSNESIGDVNEFIEQLPDKIPGVKKVESLIVPGAKFCIVHIRQNHFGGDHMLSEKQIAEKTYAEFDENLDYEGIMKSAQDKADLIKLRKVHTDIHAMLGFFISKGIKEVYKEGTVEGMTDYYQTELWAHLKEIKRQRRFLMRKREELKLHVESLIARIEALPDTPEGNIQKEGLLMQRGKTDAQIMIIERDIQTRKKLLEEDEAYIDSGLLGARDHIRNGRLKLRAGEDGKLNEKSFTARDNGNKEEFARLQEQRETYVLSQIFKNDSRVGVVMYGAKHAWSNNVEKWNKENPDAKFSLVTITTNSY